MFNLLMRLRNFFNSNGGKEEQNTSHLNTLITYKKCIKHNHSIRSKPFYLIEKNKIYKLHQIKLMVNMQQKSYLFCTWDEENSTKCLFSCNLVMKASMTPFWFWKASSRNWYLQKRCGGGKDYLIWCFSGAINCRLQDWNYFLFLDDLFL